MADITSTNQVRIIAQDVTHQQAEVCAAKRENLEDKLVALAVVGTTNAAAIASLTSAVAALTTSVTTSIAVLKVRLAISAAVGTSLPLVAFVVWEWFSNR